MKSRKPDSGPSRAAGKYDNAANHLADAVAGKRYRYHQFRGDFGGIPHNPLQKAAERVKDKMVMDEQEYKETHWPSGRPALPEQPKTEKPANPKKESFRRKLRRLLDEHYTFINIFGLK